jgi:hypothetical protein
MLIEFSIKIIGMLWLELLLTCDFFSLAANEKIYNKAWLS